jgi:hypothetical protein
MEQRANSAAPYDRLVTPKEEVYPVTVPEVALRLGVSGFEGGGLDRR